jgi:aminoacyl-histidine dipeptidase
MHNADWTSIKPTTVFACFADISNIPRGSGHEQAIGAYLMDFAASRNLNAQQDRAGNVVIKKPASANAAHSHAVILQSHMDMVCAKKPDKQFDFANQAIPVVHDGDWLRTDGTTLGADNGIGMAYALAILDEENGLPAIEAVFTVNEETGMDGALAFDANTLSGQTLINLDTEDEGVFCASCCGGQDARISLPLLMTPAAHNASWMRLGVAGLMGGHSGAEIHKGRGNAIRLLGRMLDRMTTGDNTVGIAEINGGTLHNAIPADAWADIAVPLDAMDTVAEQIEQWRSVFAGELRGAGETPILTFLPVKPHAAVMTPDSANAVLFGMAVLPHGVEAMEYDMPGRATVGTSTNFAMMRQTGETMTFTESIRSSLDSPRAMMARRIERLALAMGGVFSAGAGYPGWTYDPDSRVREIFLQAYERLNNGKKAIVEGIHAGLECGVFFRKFLDAGRKLDIVSFGPDIRNAHTPEECANIPSIARVYELLLTGLRDIAKKG